MTTTKGPAPELKYRCLRELVHLAEQDAEIDEAIVRAVRWEEEIIRQAMDTPHAVVSPKFPAGYFEVTDYRQAWKALQEAIPLLKRGQSVPPGLLLDKLAIEDPKYFAGVRGQNWLRFIMAQEPCGLEYAIEQLLPTLHSRYQMKHWAERNQDFINRAHQAKNPLEVQTEWRIEAYRMSMTHDGGALGKSVAQMVRAWDPHNKENRNIVPTGIPQIDRANGGGHGRGELMVIGGGTNHGKSYMAEYMMRLQARLGQRALYISTEDSEELFTARFIADFAEKYETREIRSKEADPDAINVAQDTAVQELRDRLYYFHAKKWPAGRICDIIRRHAFLLGIDLVIVDYLQAITPDEISNQKANDTALIVGQLKACCDEVGVALVLLSQYARDEYRNGQEPTITSCKWAGEIENESEIMVLLWRDDNDILHSKLAKLKWAKKAGRRYTVEINDQSGCFGDWVDDFSETHKKDQQERRGRYRSGGGGGNAGGTI